MKTRIQKWGNSLAVRLPKHVSEEVTLYEGAEVDVVAEEGRVVIQPIMKPVYRLQDLLAEIKPDQYHRLDEVDGPVGREEW